MKTPPKILWAEGVTLRPQHFQQQDRYHEGRLERVAAALHPYAWGMRTADWNAEALANDVLRADALSLIFQDGETYDAPGSDLLPDALDLSALPAAEASFTFYAALPAYLRVCELPGAALAAPSQRWLRDRPALRRP
jgi:type VI secretion system protein ImpJ